MGRTDVGAGRTGGRHSGLQVGRRPVRSRFRFPIRRVRLDAEEYPRDLQLSLCEHAKVLHLQFRGGGAVVNIPKRQHPASTQQHQPHRHQLDSGGQGRPAETLIPASVCAGDQSVSKQIGQNRGNDHHQNGKPVGQHFTHCHIAKGSSHHGHLGQGKDGEKCLKQMVVDHLGPHPKRHQPSKHRQQDSAPARRQSSAQQAQQQRHRRCEQKGEDHALHCQHVEAVYL